MRAELKFTASLNDPVEVVPLLGELYTGDRNAHRITVRCMKDGAEAALLGRADAWFRRADGVTVPLVGSISGSRVSVTLKDACYAVPGGFLLVIRITGGEETLTLFALSGCVRASKTETIADEGQVIPSLDRLLAQLEVLEQATADVKEAMAGLEDMTEQTQQAGESARKSAAAADTAAQQADEAAARANKAAGELLPAGHVLSVNGKTGTVTLSASDVDALPCPELGEAGQVLTKTENGCNWAALPAVKSVIVKRSYTFTGKALDPGKVQTVSGDIVLAGYNPLGIVGWRMNFSGSSGASCFGVTSSESSFSGRVKNNGTATVTPAFEVVMLYCKEG